MTLDRAILLALALINTILIEGVLIVLIQRELFARTVLLNILTNPALNILITLTGETRFTVVICYELIVVLVEAIGLMPFQKIRFSRALAISFALNATSYIVGLFLSLLSM